jgi:hypothetical protein
MNLDLAALKSRLAKAVARYWSTRQCRSARQGSTRQRDQGARRAVTGGAQMDGFIALFHELIVEAGIDEKHVFHNAALELPGFFRPTKEWDLLVVREGQSCGRFSLSPPYPLELATRLVRMFSFHGDTVLDPFSGSGTTMLAAMKWSRNSIGIEIDPDYCRMAAKRMCEENQDLFSSSNFQCVHAPAAARGEPILNEAAGTYQTRSARMRKKALK